MARRTVIFVVEGPDNELEVVDEYIEAMLDKIGLKIVDDEGDDEEEDEEGNLYGGMKDPRRPY